MKKILMISILCFSIVFINESGNEEAYQAVKTVVDYAAENPTLGLSINLTQVQGNRSQPKEFLENCE